MRQLCSVARSPPISRTVVTPCATSSGRSVSLLHLGSALTPARWTCISHKPGMRNLPRASITRASPDGAVLLTLAIRSPSIRTVQSVRGGPSVASITVTCVRAREAVAVPTERSRETERIRANLTELMTGSAPTGFRKDEVGINTNSNKNAQTGSEMYRRSRAADRFQPSRRRWRRSCPLRSRSERSQPGGVLPVVIPPAAAWGFCACFEKRKRMK